MQRLNSTESKLQLLGKNLIFIYYVLVQLVLLTWYLFQLIRGIRINMFSCSYTSLFIVMLCFVTVFIVLCVWQKNGCSDYWIFWVRVMVFNAFQQYFSCIVVVGFIGGGNQSSRRKPQSCCKSLTNYHISFSTQH